MFEAKCHCGNIQLSANEKPSSVTSCNCSLCFRYGALWAYYPSEEVKVTCRDVPSQSYVWQDKDIEFHHCPICGCLTHYISADLSEFNRIAINARMAALEVVSHLPVKKFDGG